MEVNTKHFTYNNLIPSNLPSEVMIHMLSFFGDQEIHAAMQVNSLWNAVALEAAKQNEIACFRNFCTAIRSYIPEESHPRVKLVLEKAQKKGPKNLINIRLIRLEFVVGMTNLIADIDSSYKRTKDFFQIEPYLKSPLQEEIEDRIKIKTYECFLLTCNYCSEVYVGHQQLSSTACSLIKTLSKYGYPERAVGFAELTTLEPFSSWAWSAISKAYAILGNIERSLKFADNVTNETTSYETYKRICIEKARIDGIESGLKLSETVNDSPHNKRVWIVQTRVV